MLLITMITLCVFTFSEVYSYSCIPQDWSVSWSKVGTTWYANIQKHATWHRQEEKCRNLEPGRSSLASIRSQAEQDHLKQLLGGQVHYIGGVRVANDWIFWYRDINGEKKLDNMRVTFWRDTDLHMEDCRWKIIGLYPDGTWYLGRESWLHSAFCELRCQY